MYSTSLKPFAFTTTDIDFLLAQVNFRGLFDFDGNAILNWDGIGAIYDGHHQLIWDGVSSFSGRSANGTLFQWTNTDSDGGGADTATTMTAGEQSVAASIAVQLFGTSYQNGTDLAGLRDPSGLNNNLALVNSAYGAVDQLFPRMAPADYTNYIDTLTGGVAGAFAANSTYATRYGGAGFEVIQRHPMDPLAQDFTESSDYTISVHVGPADLTTGTALDGTIVNINNIVDYTPRMISLLTTTAGVVYDTWAAHILNGEANPDGHRPNEIYYDANGVASVLDWGDLATVASGGLGQVDTQARFADSAGVGEQFIGGLNPGVSPSNSFFVTFGQFFDHGLDFIDKGGQGATIKITFSSTDPLYGMAGPDGQPVFEITMSRATIDSIDATGPQYTDHTSPFIDQSQTYGSHEQLTTLLREWVTDPSTGDYHAGMNMFDGQTLETAWRNANGVLVHDTLPTLNELRAHVEETGRAPLIWEDVLDLRNRDTSDGHLTGGTSGSALILDMNPRFDSAHLYGFYDVNRDGVRNYQDNDSSNSFTSGDVYTESASANAAQNAAVTDAIIALDAYVKTTFGANSTFEINATTHKLTLYMETLPSGSPPGTPHTLEGANAMFAFVNFANMSIKLPAGVEHDAVGTLLLASVGDHYIAGDGRVNENFGLTSIHHVFHEEHNFQVDNFISALHREAISTGNFNNLHAFQIDMTASGGSIDPITHDYLNAAGDITWNLDKMFNAAKLVVEMEYQHAAVDQYARNVTPNIQEFVGYSPDKDPSVTLEFAQSIFRWGHSTLRETIDTIDPTGGLTGKIMGYALRDAFLNPDRYMDLGPAAIILGMSHQQMNEVDEFVTPALNQGLLGQPLDLAAINIARGRDLGIPTLNDFRAALGLSVYTSWTDFGNNMQHPSSLVNFIAAYSFDGNLAAAQEVFDLVDGVITLGAITGLTTEQAFAFLEGGDKGFEQIDTWLGGLAELHQPGGLLGETFDLVFLTQIESLMDGDRFYYLFRLAGQQFAEEVGGGQLKDIVERNTGLTHLNGNIFGYADKYVDFGTQREVFVFSSGGNTETQTTSNNHKYGDVVDQNGMYLVTNASDPRLAGPHPTAVLIAPGDPAFAELSRFFAVDGVGALNQIGHENMGIYTNSGRSSALDGSVVTIGGVQYIRDTRLVDTGQDTNAANLNDGVNLDGTPNSGAESNEVLVGTERNDLIYANGGDDTVYGEGGDDIIYGGFGIDRLYGGDGSDHIYGSDNPDLIDGGTGDDFVYGESSGSDINGNDQVIGGSGNDYVSGGVGIDKLSGGTGDDHVVGDGDTDPFTHGSDGNDWVEGNSGGDILYGDNGDDLLVGGADQDQMFGGNGDDIIRPGDLTGALTIGTDETLGGDGVTDIDGNGKQGFDIIDFSDNAVRAGGVVFDLSNQINPGVTINGTPTQTQAFQMEGLIGSAGNDTLTGGSTNAAGNVDDDWIIGGSGNDILRGGAGNDVIVGGSVRLDALIGKYESAPGNLSTYDHNNANNGSTEALQLQDARYQGASHRVHYLDQLATSGVNSGILDAANNQLAGLNYDKHFTEILRSEQFRDIMLGDAAGTNLAGKNDTLILEGNPNDYTIEQVAYTGHNILRLTSAASGSDLVIDVDKFQFGTGPGAPVFTFAQMVALPTVAVGDVTMTEGDSGTTNAAFTVTLSSAYAHDVTVNYHTTNGTATAGTDYVATTGSVVIAAGQTTAIVNVSVTGDLVYEANESFTLDLTGATASGGIPVVSVPVIVADNQGVGTINNNDTTPVVSIANVTVVEGNSGTANAQFTVTQTAVSGVATTVHWQTSNVSATAGSDYVAASGDVTIAAGATSATVTIAIIGDTNFEPTETFNVTLSAPVNATLGTAIGVGTITDNDVPLFAPTDIIWNAVTPGDGTPLLGNLSNGLPGVGAIIANLGSTDADTTSGFVYGLATGSSAGFAVSAAGVVTRTGSAMAANATYTLNITSTDTTGQTRTEAFTITTGTNSVLLGTNGNDTLNATANDSVLYGSGGNDILNGAAGNDTLFGQAGNDTLNGGGGDDLIVQSSTAGRDFVDGGANGDTYQLNGNATAETFRIYTRAAWTAAGNSAAGLNANTEIVITRNGTNNASVFAELDNIEEITINTLNVTANDGNGTLESGTVGGDTIIVIGDFSTTSLNYSTITVNGGQGDDAVDISALESAHRIVFTTTGGQDTIIGQLRAQDVVNGSFGYQLAGDMGNNILTGGSGNDILLGHEGDDQLNGAAGNDILDGGTGADILNGDDGIDTADYSKATEGVIADLSGISVNAGAAIGDIFNSIENLNGSAFADNLTGNAVDNVLEGGAGSDSLNGGLGYDIAAYDKASGSIYADMATGIVLETALQTGTVTASEVVLSTDTLLGIEALSGSAFGDRIYGNETGNRLDGGSGDDIIYGEGGDDWLRGGIGADAIIGGAGNDIIDYATNVGAVYVELGAGFALETGLQSGTVGAGTDIVSTDLMSQIENAVGSGYGDRIYGNDNINQIFGGDGNDIIYAEAGNDIVIGGLGSDILLGGAGIDTLDYSQNIGAVFADLAGGATETALQIGTVSAGTAALSSDLFAQFENLTGTAYGDRLYGTAQANVLNGNGGDDFIYGGAGNDTIIGGDGADRIIGEGGGDVMTGGAGADRFIFSTEIEMNQVDTITDFTAGSDALYFLRGAFGILAGDSLALVIDGPAVEANSFIYNSTTGVVSFDTDGAGELAAVDIVNIGAGQMLTTAEIILYG
jgi:Ca2+-binding RTX toxin-like protein